MEQNTHLEINTALCGVPEKIDVDYAKVKLETNKNMGVDAEGLVHGGFIFSAADYSAMLAVNHPHVVLGKAEVNFLKPAKINESIYAEAHVIENKKQKRIVSVSVTNECGKKIFKGTFTCYVLDTHVLSLK